jgi:hypothetical protein
MLISYLPMSKEFECNLYHKVTWFHYLTMCNVRRSFSIGMAKSSIIKMNLLKMIFHKHDVISIPLGITTYPRGFHNEFIYQESQLFI